MSVLLCDNVIMLLCDTCIITHKTVLNLPRQIQLKLIQNFFINFFYLFIYPIILLLDYYYVIFYFYNVLLFHVLKLPHAILLYENMV